MARPIANSISGALTLARAPQTTAFPVNTKVWAEWAKFETFGDPQLINLVNEMAGFVLDIKKKKTPRWLSYVGTSGAGKTFLGNRVLRWVKECKPLDFIDRGNGDIIVPDAYCHWPELAKALQNNEGRDWIRSLYTPQFLFIDDIGAVPDKTGFITGELSALLGIRVAKWTLITANLSLKEISDTIDPRIASRMIRDGSRFADVRVLDYSMRKR